MRETDPKTHDYLSAGDVPGADGDRPYTGCYLCGGKRSEHRDAKPSKTPNVDEAMQLISSALALRCHRCDGQHLTVTNEPPIAGFPMISYVCRDCGLDSVKQDNDQVDTRAVVVP
jgi:hypothetical protein